MTVTSKEVYRILRAELQPQMKAAGFRRLKTGELAWTRPLRQEHLTLWFQCHPRGSDNEMGSNFVLEFQLDPRLVAGAPRLSTRRRFGPLLTEEERETVWRMNDRILGALPDPGPNRPVRTQYLHTLRQPYLPNTDIWLHYTAKEHVSDWAAFFRPRMLDLVSRFERQVCEA